MTPGASFLFVFPRVALGPSRGDFRARDGKGPINPPAQVDEPAAVGAEGERGQVGQGLDRVRFGTGRTAPLDHEPAPFEGGDGFGDSVLAGVELDVSAGFASPADLSAAAPFL